MRVNLSTKSGWFNESYRHSLSARGVKTGRKASPKVVISPAERHWRKWTRDSLKKDMMDNLKLFHKKEKEYNKEPGIRVGDWIKDGDKYSRVTYIWRDEHDKPFQIQDGGDAGGSFYLDGSYVSYSGSLDSGYDTTKTEFRKLNYTRIGRVWFFKHDFATAGGGIDYLMKFRVFEVKK